MQKTALNLVDQQYLPLDRVEPVCIFCELRVRGRLDYERVVDAVRTAISHHPMARSQLTAFKWPHRHRHWEIVDEVQELPVEVVECAESDGLDEARSRLLSRPIDLYTAPPLALMLAHRAGGDSLSMSLSHVAADGVSSHRLMRSIACAYAGVEDSISGPDPLVVRDLSFCNRTSASTELMRRLRRKCKLAVEQRSKGFTRFAAQGGEQQARDAGFRGFQLLHLNRDETAVAMARRRPPATINDLLIASLAVAVRRWNDAHGVEPQRLTVHMAVNLRPREWITEIVSNLVTDARVAVPESAQRDIDRAQLAVAEQTRVLKRSRASGELEIRTMLNLVPSSLRYPLVRVLQKRPGHSAAGLSYLGHVDAFPDFAHDAGPVTEFWFGPPGGAALGTLAGALIMRAELFFALHYRRAESDSTGTQAFAETWREVLLGNG